MKTFIFMSMIPLIVAGFTYAAQNETVHSITLPVIHTELKPGAGKEKTETLCNICHGVDYITMQPKFSNSVWTAEVDKMIRVMGAPITEKDAKIIIDYLSAEYGRGE